MGCVEQILFLSKNQEPLQPACYILQVKAKKNRAPNITLNALHKYQQCFYFSLKWRTSVLWVSLSAHPFAADGKRLSIINAFFFYFQSQTAVQQRFPLMPPRKVSVTSLPMSVGLMVAALVCLEGISPVPATEASLEPIAMRVSLVQ